MTQTEWWTSSCGRVEIEIPVEAIRDCSHPGQCDADVAYWYDKVDWSHVDRRNMELGLKYIGAWDDLPTVSVETLKQRLLWIACNDLREEGKGVTA